MSEKKYHYRYDVRLTAEQRSKVSQIATYYAVRYSEVMGILIDQANWKRVAKELEKRA
jgi:hypothetical protein